MSEYSVRFLMKSESYGRTRRARNKDIPISVMVILMYRLREASKRLLQSPSTQNIGIELGCVSTEIEQRIYEEASFS
jgi:hypothetical protein